jgi:hypothetical protein
VEGRVGRWLRFLAWEEIIKRDEQSFAGQTRGVGGPGSFSDHSETIPVVCFQDRLLDTGKTPLEEINYQIEN